MHVPRRPTRGSVSWSRAHPLPVPHAASSSSSCGVRSRRRWGRRVITPCIQPASHSMLSLLSSAVPRCCQMLQTLQNAFETPAVCRQEVAARRHMGCPINIKHELGTVLSNTLPEKICKSVPTLLIQNGTAFTPARVMWHTLMLEYRLSWNFATAICQCSRNGTFPLNSLPLKDTQAFVLYFSFTKSPTISHYFCTVLFIGMFIFLQKGPINNRLWQDPINSWQRLNCILLLQASVCLVHLVFY